jgi:hypothetical protein
VAVIKVDEVGTGQERNELRDINISISDDLSTRWILRYTYF